MTHPLTLNTDLAAPVGLRRDRIRPVSTRTSPVHPVLHIPDVGDGQTLHRLQPEVGQTGIHPAVIKAVAGLYAAMVVVFWMVFGRGEARLALGFITLLGLMYFGLLSGLSLVADAPAEGETVRSLGAFLNGRVSTYTGWISGREAVLQILTLPTFLVGTAIVLGAIYGLAAHGLIPG